MFSRFKWRPVNWLIFLATVCTSALFSASADAQTTAAGTKLVDKLIVSDLREITVTATRTRRKVADTPESVSIVDTEQIRTRQAADIGDVLRYLPNIELGGGPRNLGLSPTIRGMSDGRILFLLDGARQDFNRGHNARIFTDPSLLKRVDVMRGPASTVWGSGALGGVISFTTLDATDLLRGDERFGTKIRGGFQSMNEQYIPGLSVFGLAGESFDYLLDFSYRNAASDIRHGDGSRLQNSQFESYAGLAKFNWTPGDHRFTFSTQTFDQTGEIPANSQAVSTPGALVDRNTEQRNYTLRYRYEETDNALLNPEVLVYHNTTYSFEKRLLDRRRDETDFSTTGINARNSSHFNLASFATQRLTYGVDYYHNEAKGKRNGVPRSEFPRGEADVVGVYLQDEITLWERLSLIPGVRWDYFSSQANGIGASTNTNDRVNFKLGGLLKITEWFSITGGYNEAFRAPTLGELFTTGTHFSCGRGCANLFVPNPNLKPETAFNKEVGARIHKSDLLYQNDHLAIRGAYFHNKVKDFVDLMVDFVFFPVSGNPGRGGITTSDNVRDAVLEGFEIEANYAAQYGYAGFSYAQTRGYNRTDGGVLSNIQPDKWIIMAGLTWPTYSLSLGWRSSIVEAQNRVPTGGTATPGYTLHDLTLTWLPQNGSFKGVRLDLGIDNLTDKDYRRHLSVLKDPGRNYKLAVSYQF
ncbi:TonB-dependent hemoglobin/transferrin/lactoferrin family receptor [Nitrosomonas sp. HPC101]|uniref:TonB-dependent hemoglobin/transferrin/lactoferrin family receptor n=1 Tax=Nitrosomonas sp. HPC101 TaxID=1658667 RepID=UPI00136F0FA9|nr:TonB-dependent hemoglobin/transferrin/lactoferrin family receptor [Nitrosomonas sp. HPC101]MXS85887.1 TonB-dependent hemoglobin/transferrin/lactoferrin family receptor [Nitrosomonas sp. HPC101]